VYLGRVQEQDWSRFFRRFSREHHGWRTTVELHEAGEIPRRIADACPLEEIRCGEASPDLPPAAATVWFRTAARERSRGEFSLECVDVRVADEGPGGEAVIKIDMPGESSAIVHVWRADFWPAADGSPPPEA
jgi:hypothetical protein